MGIKDTAQRRRAWVIRDRIVSFGTKYSNAYVGDTFTKKRLTLNLGLRFDHQSGSNKPSEAAANPAFPELLPALDYAGGGQGVEWNDLSPRVELHLCPRREPQDRGARVLCALREPARHGSHRATTTRWP